MTVPLLITVVTLVWMFRFIDGVARPLSEYVLGREVPGLGVLMTAAFILVVGAMATNVIGRRILQQGEKWLLNVPLFKTVYAPVKQLVAAFSPDSESGFKKVVIVDDARRGTVIGFLTREFTIDRGAGPEAMIAVYVPTNHLYLGDVAGLSAVAGVFSGRVGGRRRANFSDGRNGAARQLEATGQQGRGDNDAMVMRLIQRVAVVFDAGDADVAGAAGGATRGRGAPAGRRGQHPAAGSQPGRLPGHDRPPDPALGPGRLRAGAAVRRSGPTPR